MSDPFTPVEIDPLDRPLLEKIGRLRVLAWSTAVPDAAAKVGDCWLDEFELAARHWCVFHDGEPVAAARLSVHDRIEDVPDAEVYAGVFPAPLPAPIASFNRLVVHPDFRGRGLVEQFDEVRVCTAEQIGCRCGVGESHAGMKRLDKLVRAGFKLAGSAQPHAVGPFVGVGGVIVYVTLPRNRV